MQKINKPDVVCDDPQEEPEPTSCSEHVSGGRGPGRGAAGGAEGASSPRPPPTSAPQRAECEGLLTAAAFEECLGLVPLAPYVRACVRDRCQCSRGASCACSTVAEFSRQCSHAGGQPGNWRNATLCRECPRARRGGGARAPWGDAPRGAWRPSPARGRCPGLPVRSHICRPQQRPRPWVRGVGEAGREPGRLHATLGLVGSAACLCPFSQELPWEHGLPGERLALHGHLLSPGGQQPVRGAPHGRLFLPRR